MKRPPAPIDQDMQRDRFGHNGVGAEPHYSRITYLASAKGYVMARRPGCTPWVISEALWRSFDYWSPATSAAAPCGVADARGWSCCGKPANCSRARDKPAVNPSDLNCC